jgi:hypothetical protein
MKLDHVREKNGEMPHHTRRRVLPPSDPRSLPSPLSPSIHSFFPAHLRRKIVMDREQLLELFHGRPYQKTRIIKRDTWVGGRREEVVLRPAEARAQKIRCQGWEREVSNLV